MDAFLQRVVNDGGWITREYGLGRRRTNLFAEWPIDKTQGCTCPTQKVVIDLEQLRKGFEITLTEGLEQAADYGRQLLSSRSISAAV